MSRLKKQLWISVGIIVGVVIVASAALYFLSGDVTAQADKIVSDRAHVALANSAVSVLASLKSDAALAAPYKVQMDEILPTHNELVGFPQALNALGQADNVSVSFAFQGGGTATTPSTPGSDSFSLNVTGTPSNLAAFLKDLESQKSGFIVAIDSFDFSNNGTTYRLTSQGRVFSRGS